MNVIDRIWSIRRDLTNLTEVLRDVRETLAEAGDELKTAGKTIRRANMEQPSYVERYEEIRGALQTLSDAFEIRILQQRAKVLKMISEESQVSYGERMMTQLAEEDPTLVELKLNRLDVQEILELAKAKCAAFTARGYTLRNLTDLAVAQEMDYTLHEE
jgi:hypothetical protein